MKNAMTAIIVLANLALLTFANSTHAATTAIDGVTWTYIHVEGGISLSNGYRSVIDNSLTGAMQVPEYIDGIPVIEIGSDAFIGCSFSNIILPSSVKKIGDGAFYGCDRLASIEFPDSITEFGDSMFTKCSSLRMVKLPRYIKSIPDATFCDCWSLEVTNTARCIYVNRRTCFSALL